METISSKPLNTAWGHFSLDKNSFGDVFTTFTNISNYDVESSSYSGGILRWPGGSIAEDKSNTTNRFDLTYPDLYSYDSSGSNDKGMGFSEILKYADSHAQNLSMILPVYDYYKLATSGDGGLEIAISTYVSDIGVFVNRLSNFNDGYYDEAKQQLNDNSIIFEIGNEVSHLGWNNHVYDEQVNYGTFAYEALQAIESHDSIQEFLSSGHLEIGVLSGASTGGAQNIIEELNGSKPGRESVLDSIDKLICHWGLTSNAQGTMWLGDRYADGVTYDEQVKTILKWKDALGDHWHDVSLYASEWGVGRSGLDAWNFPGDTTDNPYKYIDPKVLSPSARAELTISDIGARHGSATIDVYTRLVSLGFSETSLWGTVDPAVNSSSYQSIWGSTSEWHTAPNTMPLSHGGEVLRIMSEVLPGMALRKGNVDILNSIYRWNSTYFDWTTGTGSGEVNTYTYSSNNKIAIFLTTTDIDGYRCTSDGELQHSIDLSDFGGLSDAANIETVGTKFMLDEWREFRDSYLVSQSLSTTDEYLYRRLFEAPDVDQSLVELPNDRILTYTFHSDFEVACITIDREVSVSSSGEVQGTPSGDVINGTVSDDHIRTYAGNDKIHGNSGSDVIFSGLGKDIIYGDAGDDVLIGRAGDDYINGGSGADKLRGGRGSEILDGGNGNDRLVGHDGNDTLIGGHGNDILKGGNGSDTFVFTEDFGGDRIRDVDTGAGGDILDFSGTITDYSQLSIGYSPNGLNTMISVVGTDDYVVLVGISPDSFDCDQYILL